MLTFIDEMTKRDGYVNYVRIAGEITIMLSQA